MEVKPGQTPLIDPENPPDWTKPEWFHNCPNEPHIDTPLHRGRLMMASEFVHDIALNRDDAGSTISDLGAGDGGLLEQLKDLEPEGYRCWGYDLAFPSFTYAREVRGVDVRLANVLRNKAEYGDIAIATEFLEHMVDPHGVVRYIAKRSRYLVASSPHTETLEHHYPLHTWAFDLDGYRALLEDNGFSVFRQEATGMFQVIAGVHK